MSYAIISLGGKQYRVREGERLLVDRIAAEDGNTITPPVLLVGGNGDPQIAPSSVVVTAKVLGQQRGPKIRIGKYKKRTGYKRHNGFRSALTQIQIESIGAGRASAAKSRAAAKPHVETALPASAPVAKPLVVESPLPAATPAGYAEMTVVEIKSAVGSWAAAEIAEALAYEQAHGKRKGAIAALESALAEKEA
ncbi:MAG: 50S ribosomal protein L21 [Gaiellaceae bacterium]